MGVKYFIPLALSFLDFNGGSRVRLIVVSVLNLSLKDYIR